MSKTLHGGEDFEQPMTGPKPENTWRAVRVLGTRL